MKTRKKMGRFPVQQQLTFVDGPASAAPSSFAPRFRFRSLSAIAGAVDCKDCGATMVETAVSGVLNVIDLYGV